MECSVPFSLLEPHHCQLTGNTFNSEPVSTIRPPPPPSAAKRQRKEEKKREKRLRKDDESDNRVKEEDEHVDKRASNAATSTQASASTAVVVDSTNGGLRGEQVEQTKRNVTEIDPDNVITLKGHQSEVFSCAWNPVVSSLLASGYKTYFFLLRCTKSP